MAAVAAAVAGGEVAPAESAAPVVPPDAVPVVVEAQDEVGVAFENSYLLPPSDAIRPLLDAWAHDNQVPTSCVTFEDAEGRILDLDRSPAELGWLHASSPIRVFARPAEEEAEDGGTSEAQLLPGGSPSSPVAPPFPAAPWNSAAAPWNKGFDPDDEEVDLFGDADDGGGATRSAPEPEPKRRRLETEAAAATKDPPTRPRATAVKAGARRKPATRVIPANGEEAQEEHSTPLGSERPTKSAGCFGEDEIVFQESNPKPKDSQAHDRYDAYKVARTVREALSLGASRDDIAYDLKRGFLRRRAP